MPLSASPLRVNGQVGRSRVMAPPGTPARLPVAILVCNQAPPVTDPATGAVVTPSLMTFDQCTTLFHETGHGLQHMLTTVDEGAVSGISGVEWDAVEQPSQFMEYWVRAYRDWLPLRAVKCHGVPLMYH